MIRTLPAFFGKIFSAGMAATVQGCDIMHAIRYPLSAILISEAAFLRFSARALVHCETFLSATATAIDRKHIQIQVCEKARLG